MNEIIVRAIKEKRLLSFTYDELPRVVEPHSYGHTTADHEVLCCYQVKGSGVHAEGDPWHLIHVPKISSLSLLQETFSAARPGYKRRDKRMLMIYSEI